MLNCNFCEKRALLQVLRSNSRTLLGTPPPPPLFSACAAREIEDDRVSVCSEVSLACLQDRIVQMQDAHFSTTEELQATLAELTDLQV
jgi:hypothetical protein